MKYVSGPYFEPDFDPLLDRFGTPRVVVDNETREDCTLVKVDSVNRDGVLLEMVHLLTDLDLIISKSYISFLAECAILFGRELRVVGSGEFAGPASIPLPPGSVLVLAGNGADVAKHSVSAVHANSALEKRAPCSWA